MSALRLSWALIEQRKRNNPLCATGLVRLLHSALSWLAVLGAVQCWALCNAARYAALGGGCTMLRTVQRCGQCSAGRSEALGAVKRCALCSAARCVALRAVHCVALRTV